MSRATPEDAFAEARAAMERGDRDGFRACLDAGTLLRIAENGVGRLLAGGPATGALNVFRFRTTDTLQLKGELTVHGDSMTGGVTIGTASALRRVVELRRISQPR
jgi:hypothetical protein